MVFHVFFGNLLLVLFRKWLVAPKMDVFTPRPSIPSGGLLQAQCEFQDPKLLNWRYGTRFFVRPIKGGSGWWFQTWIWFSISYMGCHPSNWRTPSFFRGVGFKPPTSYPKNIKLYTMIDHYIYTIIYIVTTNQYNNCQLRIPPSQTVFFFWTSSSRATHWNLPGLVN